jgi:hypothetical protein
VGDRQTYFGAAVVMALVAVTWIPLRRMAGGRFRPSG